MKEYLQPHFYHFSQDPILLADSLVEKASHHSQDENFNLIDLCSGCGIGGIEVIRKFSLTDKKVKQVIFIEKQFEFLPFLEINIEKFVSNHISTKVFFNSLPDLNLAHPIYLLCNPPFYRDGEGRKSDSIQKNLCNFINQKEAQEIISWLLKMIKTHENRFFFTFIVSENSFWIKEFSKFIPSVLVSKDEQLSSRRIISNF